MDRKEYLLAKQIWLSKKMMDTIEKSITKYQHRNFYNEVAYHFLSEYQEMHSMIDEIREIAELLGGNKQNQ